MVFFRQVTSGIVFFEASDNQDFYEQIKSIYGFLVSHVYKFWVVFKWKFRITRFDSERTIYVLYNFGGYERLFLEKTSPENIVEITLDRFEFSDIKCSDFACLKSRKETVLDIEGLQLFQIVSFFDGKEDRDVFQTWRYQLKFSIHKIWSLSF